MINVSIQPDLKRRIEKLLIWLIPFFIISVIAPFFVKQMLQSAIDNSVTSGVGLSEGFNNLIVLSGFLGYIDNLIVAVWFYPIARDYKFNKFLWPIFAIIKPFFALIIFLFLVFFQNSEDSSNQPFKRDEETAGESE